MLVLEIQRKDTKKKEKESRGEQIVLISRMADNEKGKKSEKGLNKRALFPPDEGR